jgi:hypothetical protein
VRPRSSRPALIDFCKCSVCELKWTSSQHVVSHTGQRCPRRRVQAKRSIYAGRALHRQVLTLNVGAQTLLRAHTSILLLEAGSIAATTPADKKVAARDRCSSFHSVLHCFRLTIDVFCLAHDSDMSGTLDTTCSSSGAQLQKRNAHQRRTPQQRKTDCSDHGETYPMDACFKLGRIYMKQLSNE